MAYLLETALDAQGAVVTFTSPALECCGIEQLDVQIEVQEPER